jgi:polar amino acid transport system substrate-binding protein
MLNRTLRVGAGAALVAVSLAVAVSTAGAAGQAKKITFCVDMTYPPMESIVGGKPVGADIDIASAVAKQLHASASFKNTGFDVIIPALLHKKCDAIISSMTDNAQRRKQVDFADYVTVGMLLMVKKGNPGHISGLASLSGKTVAVETATTEGDVLKQLNKTFAKQHKKSVSVKSFPADTNAAAALLAGKVDAYFADATPVLYYIKKTHGKFQVAGKQVQAAPEGVATRKGDPLGKQVGSAISKLYANGTMKKILAKWGISQFALKK